MRESSFIVLLGASLLLHAAGMGGALAWFNDAAPEPAQKASIRLALGSSGRAAGTTAPPPQPAPKPPEPAPKEPEVKTKPKPIKLPKPPPPEEPEPIVEKVVEPPDEPEPPPPPPTRPPSEPGQDGLSGRDGPTKTDTEGAKDEAGYQALLLSHDALVLGHLSQFKSYPFRARMLGEQGDVRVEFQIDRDGALLSARVLDASDRQLLDNAALKQMRDAEPYPAAPIEARWRIRTYRTKMRFRLTD